ncbi:MAG: iron ABC transporter permease [Anaerolineae bacterium]|nr:iron ABC transporter permease [Anaerolineae bacterium]
MSEITLERAQAAEQMIWSRRRAALIALAVGLAAAFAASLALGSVSIPLGDILTILRGGEGARASWTTIVMEFRLPKALTAALAGTALSVSGLLMQTLFRNPLADPYVLGISSGASLGVALVVLATASAGVSLFSGLTFVGDVGLITAASLGAALVLAVVAVIARRVRHTMTLLIIGLMVGYMTGSLVSILMHFSIPDRIQTYVNWTFGTFGGVTWSQMPLFAVAILIGLVTAGMVAKPLNAFLLGETYARSMGVDVRRARWAILAAASLLAGAVTAFCGPIGFLGVAVPHLCRILLGTSDHRYLMPATALLGAALALVADVIAQVPGAQVVLPLNAITALIGAPVVVWVILARRNLRETFSA